MKTRILISSLLSAMALTAFAQQVENDDMYFNSRDRQKFREAQASGLTMTSSRAASRMSEVSRETSDNNVNPTDSYSARNTNPEYSARSNAEIAAEDNQDYFIQDYRLTPEGSCPDCGTAIPGRWGRQFEGQITSSPFLPGRRLRVL